MAAHHAVADPSASLCHPRLTFPRCSSFASPTRMALTNTKTQLKSAQTGHSLLAKKRDALMTRFRAILKKVDEVRRSCLRGDGRRLGCSQETTAGR